ncbi:MAG: shikimate dehydrogenase [Bacteroidota bacterium]
MQKFGLIGRKLSHSFSRQYFTQKFDQEDIDASYHLFELGQVHELPELLRTEKYLKGLNVTIPYKEAVIPYLSELSEEAKSIGAVNTIAVEGGLLKGYNTDVYGFYHSLRTHVKKEALTDALILGTGGAAKAVHFVLKNWLNCSSITWVSRSGGREEVLTYEQLHKGDLGHYSIVVNTTPLGMYPDINSAPDLAYEQFRSGQLAFDLVYNPEETLFMKRAAEQGATTQNGLPMLIGQAEKAWEIWQQKNP